MRNTDTAFLLPAYNPGDEVLAATLKTLRDQTHAADIVIVDDGSTVPLSQRIAPAAGLTVLRQEPNGGITRALNHGLTHILEQGYTYAARMDCGDTCSPDRIAKQHRFMEHHPGIELLGCLAEVVTPAGERLHVYGGGSPEELSRKLGSNCPMLHPTFFFRTALIGRIGPYSIDYPAAEDYELMLRADTGSNLACLDEILVSCVADPRGITLSNRKRQLHTRLKAQLRYFRPTRIGSYGGVAKTLAIRSVPSRYWPGLKQRLKALGV